MRIFFSIDLQTKKKLIDKISTFQELYSKIEKDKIVLESTDKQKSRKDATISKGVLKQRK